MLPCRFTDIYAAVSRAQLAFDIYSAVYIGDVFDFGRMSLIVGHTAHHCTYVSQWPARPLGLAHYVSRVQNKQDNKKLSFAEQALPKDSWRPATAAFLRDVATLHAAVRDGPRSRQPVLLHFTPHPKLGTQLKWFGLRMRIERYRAAD